MEMSIKILKSVLDQVTAHAEETYPEECCGLLIGPRDDKRVIDSVRMRNAFDGPRHDRYHIDPLELAKADRAAARKGLQVTGIYHSHPDYPAVLSAYDLEHSFPWYSYVVVSVPKGKAGEIRSWIPDEGPTRSREEQIEVVTEVA
jgi:proteasome lid subunit RPN8/RPN11